MMTDKPYEPIVIIGAPRSGTNMLRDFVCCIDDFATWPCDEINYIWRHGNRRFPHDEFSEDMVTHRIRRYVDRQFRWVAQQYGVSKVVEKTCANSLRVGYVDAVLDAPRYIFIHRSGIDAVQSAMRRWTASLDIRYVFSKARFVPVNDVPYYATRYFMNRISRWREPDKRLSTWGPVPVELAEGHPYSLAEVCALQWRACVDSSLNAFRRIESCRVLCLRYETLVANPHDEAARLARFLDIDEDELTQSDFITTIRKDSVGTARQHMDAITLQKVEGIVAQTQSRLDLL